MLECAPAIMLILQEQYLCRQVF